MGVSYPAGFVLLGFPVYGVLTAEAAVFVELQPVGVVLLVLKGVVIPLLALGAGQCDLHAHTLPPGY
jgi:hypothetical protein